MKIAAIVPALNEEENVRDVLKVLLSCKELDEVILVDDGSVDRTAEIGQKLGAKVIKLPKRGGSGKGNALLQGIKGTNAEIVLFCDADLKGFSIQHINLLIKPLLKKQVVMCVGIRDRLSGLAKSMAEIDPILAISGERALKKSLLEKIPYKFLKGFAVESALNYYCFLNDLPVKHVLLKNLDHVIKEKKWGFWKGFGKRVRMMGQILKVRYRMLILRIKNKICSKKSF